MKSIHRELLIVFVCLALGYTISFYLLPRHGERAYNCSIAEISPDYPIEVKEQCRKLNAQRNK